jgi:hypothetical protein
MMAFEAKEEDCEDAGNQQERKKRISMEKALFMVVGRLCN